MEPVERWDPLAPSAAARGPVPEPCLTAIHRADQAISYLVAKIRDRRLSASMLGVVAGVRW